MLHEKIDVILHELRIATGCLYDIELIDTFNLLSDHIVYSTGEEA